MRPGNRRSAMRVRDGRVQKKNNWALDRGDYNAWTQAEIRIDRKDPGYASRHLITVAQLREFLYLLPDWDQLTIGLDAIVLDAEQDAMGWCTPGVVAVCAWEADLWWDHAHRSWVDEHRDVLETLEVDCERPRDVGKLRPASVVLQSRRAASGGATAPCASKQQSHQPR